uniref:Tektin n=1 Tax=Bos taurus TaxID=9913 RepID=A0A3Q1MR16_BOVIN
MATLSVKPSPRFRLPDWQTNSYLLSTNAERQRDASHQIRQEARVLRNETNNQTIWDEHDNRTRLAERIDTVSRWKEMLDKCLTDLDAEIDALAQMKESAEQNLQAKNLPLDVAIECLTLRESRRDIDVVKDPVEEELHKEVEVIEATKKALQQKISQAFEKLFLLQEARQRLNSDHRGKMETLDIDRGCLSLNLTSPNISLKINPTRVPNGSTSLQQWDDLSRFNKDHGEAEMKKAIELREAIALTIAEVSPPPPPPRSSMAKSWPQRALTHPCLMVSVLWHPSLHLSDTLRWPELIPSLCPAYFLFSDQQRAQYGLTDEVHQLEATIAALKQKLAQAQDALDALYKHLARLQADIACKANSMLLDTKCMDTRRKLTVPAEKFVPEVDTFTRTTNRTLSPLKTCQLELA